jgi:hypothetical protein
MTPGQPAQTSLLEASQSPTALRMKHQYRRYA